MQIPNLPPLPEDLRPDPAVVELHDAAERMLHRRSDRYIQQKTTELRQLLAFAEHATGAAKTNAYSEAATVATRLREPEAAASITLQTQDALTALRHRMPQ